MHYRPKTDAELNIMREGGKILNAVHEATFAFIRPGKSLKEIDAFIRQEIESHGAAPSFLGYHGFPASSCLSLNDVVVHGIPNDYVLKDSDVLGVDIGVLHEGYHTDSAFTKAFAPVKPEVAELLAVTQGALEEGIGAAIAGNTVGDISMAIEAYILSHDDYGIIRDLCGHGIGQKLQDTPEIPNYAHSDNSPLINGMTLAIEPMVSLGTWKVTVDADEWTVRTKDNSISAHFETTIAIRDNDPEILVQFPLTKQAWS